MDQSTALSELFKQVRKFYLSNNGKNLSVDDWLHFKEYTEICNEAYKDEVLCLRVNQKQLPILTESTELLTQKLLTTPFKDRAEKNLRARAASFIEGYSFIFELLKSKGNITPQRMHMHQGCGPSTKKYIESVLADFGLSFDMSLEPYVEYLDSFTIRMNYTLEDQDSWFSWDVPLKENWMDIVHRDGSCPLSISAKFEPELNVELTLSKQIWQASAAGQTATRSQKREAIESLVNLLKGEIENNIQNFVQFGLKRVELRNAVRAMPNTSRSGYIRENSAFVSKCLWQMGCDSIDTLNFGKLLSNRYFFVADKQS